MIHLDFVVQTFQVDPRARLTAPWLCAAFQEAAWRDAEALGFGMSWVAREGLLWALQRLRVEIAALPPLGAPFSVTSWPSGADRLLARREFEARERESGDPFARATSRWVVVDARTRRAVRMPEIVRALPPPDRAPALDGELPILEEPATEGAERRFEVRRSDLDVARHANHIRHLEWALEAVPDALAEVARPGLVDIAFRREAMRGETVVSVAVPDPSAADSFRHVLRRGDGVEISRALSRWTRD